MAQPQPIHERQSAPDPSGTRNEDLIIDGAELTEALEFDGVTFNGRVEIRNTRLRKDCSFKGCVFNENVTFENVTCDTKVKIDFSHAVFRGTVKFKKNCQLYSAHFSNSQFRRSANFGTCIFRISAHFDSVSFGDNVSFDRAVFNSTANFSKTRFGRSARFQRVLFKYHLSNALFTDAKFLGEALFNMAHFSGSVRFDDVIFQSGANFENAHFCEYINTMSEDDDGISANNRWATGAQRVIDFSRAKFLNGGSVLSDEKTLTLVDFGRVWFGDRNAPRDIIFDGVRWGQKRVDLAGDVFLCRFDRCRVFGDISFKNGEFDDQVGVSFDFRSARFNGTFDFSALRTSGDIIFTATQFSGEALFHNTQFATFPDFKDATLSRTPDLHTVTFPTPQKITNITVRTQTLQKIAELRRITSRGNDRKTDSELHVAELKVESGITSILYGIASSHGSSWLRPLLWLLCLALFVFPVGYLITYRAHQVEINQFIATGQLTCAKGDGSAVIAALEYSVRRALFFAPHSEVRATTLANCLKKNTAIGLWSVLGLLLETLQVVSTAIFVFLSGLGIRNRLRING